MKNQLLFMIIFLCMGAYSQAQTVTGDDVVYKVVEQSAEYPGGFTALTAFLKNNLEYPATAKEEGLQGKVFVSFIVEKDGSLSDVKVLKDKVGGGANEAAIKVVSAMPHWLPAMQDGKTVRCQYTLPISFKL